MAGKRMSGDKATVYRLFKAVRAADAATVRKMLPRDSTVRALRRAHDSDGFCTLMAEYAVPRYPDQPDRYERCTLASPAWVAWATRTGDVATVSAFLDFRTLTGRMGDPLFCATELDFTYGTPLHVAIRWRFLDVALLLIDAGANVNLRDGYGKTPLELARAVGDARLVRRLTEAGAQ